ncbi:MAG: phosphoribosylamine--glycine ligase [Bacteroidia bacterium]|nr:phosphoribosylamine--glycine ligase [Bacteroidia bacterium]HQV00605.1 phosphoribosylamine--glycine ligase [Bacteroidia bacterium]
MNVLLLGSGGREHAFAYKIAQSKMLTQLFVAPGNAGTLQCGTNVNISVTDFETIHRFVIDNQIKLVVVGPEDPLVSGIADYFLQTPALQHVPVVGPVKAGARLEGSKEYSKKFMIKYGIPTAAYQSFNASNLELGYKFLESLLPPYVLKADGLAAGKGVLILNDLSEAKQMLQQMIMDKKFGTASTTVVIEEFMHGIECSVFVLTDGISYKILPTAKDYKRIGDNDTGPNTGGMGAVSPVPFCDDAFMQKVTQQIIEPTFAGLKNEAINYCGFLFIGLMNDGGNPRVVEYNVRMGDPETEVVLPRIQNDLLEMLWAAGTKNLEKTDLQISPKTAVTVVMVSGGYPDAYQKNKPISGLDNVTESIVFHAGTTSSHDTVVTNGGRVLVITSMDNDIAGAAAKSYKTISMIDFENQYYRTDIGNDLVP